MSSDNSPLSDLTALEAALASLAPRADRLDRDRVMFRAGQASAAQLPAAHRRTWPAAFAAMTAVAAVLLVAIVLRPEPQPTAARPGQSNGPGGTKTDAATPSAADDAEPSPLRNTPRLPAGDGQEVKAVEVAASSSPSEASPVWPFEGLTRGRSGWRQEQLARAGLSFGPDARLLERDPAGGIPETNGSADAVAKRPVTLPSPIPYRELLDRLLKQEGGGKTDGPS